MVLGCRYTPKTILDRLVSEANFSTVGVLECDIAHRRSVAVLCMLYKVGCNQMQPLYGALPGAYMCHGASYMLFFGRTSLHLCASSVQNLAVPQEFDSFVSISVERSW